MEDYIAEEVTGGMRRSTEELATLFHRQLAEDAAVGNDLAARLEVFACRHTSRDWCHMLYPILRIDIAPTKLRKSR